MYITNRGWNTTAGGRHGPGSISVLDPRTRRVVATWPVPGGGSPDMGNVSADGKELWVSGRYDEEVYVFDTETGRMTHRIKVGHEPHGLCVWPQPGRYSLGHTGNMR
jgi:YVTN family beta-propeller protein